MERKEALDIVKPFIVKHNQYTVVSRMDTKSLIGSDKYDILLKDKIRNLGPSSDSIYYWNVVDYVQSSVEHLLKQINKGI